MDPADLAKESGSYPVRMGRQQGSLSRGEATQISPFANHSGYRVESTSEAVRGKQGSQLQVEECHNNTRQFGGGLDQGVKGFETC